MLSIFTTAIHIRGRSSTRYLRDAPYRGDREPLWGHAMPWWQGPTLRTRNAVVTGTHFEDAPCRGDRDPLWERVMPWWQGPTLKTRHAVVTSTHLLRSCKIQRQSKLRRPTTVQPDWPQPDSIAARAIAQTVFRQLRLTALLKPAYENSELIWKTFYQFFYLVTCVQERR